MELAKEEEPELASDYDAYINTTTIIM